MYVPLHCPPSHFFSYLWKPLLKPASCWHEQAVSASYSTLLSSIQSLLFLKWLFTAYWKVKLDHCIITQQLSSSIT